MTTSSGEPRIVLGTIAIVGFCVLMVFVRHEGHRQILDDSDRAHARALEVLWSNAARVERCPRPALREPVTGDGSQLLVDTERTCYDSLRNLRDQLQPPCKPRGEPCPMTKLAALAPRPDIVAACAPLYDRIERLAHATEACSPLRVGQVDWLHDMPLTIMSPAYAVTLEILPLVATGELGAAARRVTDAMRFADDYGRATSTMGAMLSSAGFLRLADTLDELLADPRLTADDARAIGRDLDVLYASMPTFADMVHHQAVEGALNDTLRTLITHDLEQDRAMKILGIERWLRDFDRACAGTTLRGCIEDLRAARRGSQSDDFDRALHSALDDGTVRDRVIQRIASEDYEFMLYYGLKLAYREFTLRALRMQAELRTASLDECRDPQRRRALLARWLDDITLGNEPEPTLVPPAWQSAGRFPPGPSRVLRCVERHPTGT